MHQNGIMARLIFATKMPLHMLGEFVEIASLFLFLCCCCSICCRISSAYKDAMDVQKHGGQIYLPQHLHEKLPTGSRYLLTSS